MSSEKNKNSEKTEESKQDTEKEPESKVSGSTTDLLRSHAVNIHQAISRMDVNRKKKFYFFTIPGILRIVQMILALVDISVFGYYCTNYDDEVKKMLPPYCLSQTREQYFMLCNYHTLMGCLTIILAGIFSPFSNAALLSSLYPLLFDSIQSFLLFVSTIALMQFYRGSSDQISKVMPEGSAGKVGMTFLGFLLACLHVASAIYDGIVFIKYLHGFRTGQKDLEKEENSLLQKSN